MNPIRVLVVDDSAVMRGIMTQVINAQPDMTVAAVLVPGGLLFLGHSESCAAGHAAFRTFGKTAYQRR